MPIVSYTALTFKPEVTLVCLFNFQVRSSDFCQTASKSLPPSPFVYFFPPRQSIQVLALWIYFLSDIRLDLQNFSFNRHNNGILVSYILDWWTHYINKMISRTIPLVDTLYKPNNIQDYPIDGRII